MHRVAVVAVPPVTTFDLSIPELVLGAVLIDGRPGYDVQVCTAQPGPVVTQGRFEVIVARSLDTIDDAESVFVTGTSARDGIDHRILAALRRAHAAGKRIVSICTGAFVLAQAGLLDNRPATTHWDRSEEFRARFPLVDLRPDVLYVDDGDVLSSAGLTAGIDLCVHLVRRDYGAAAANTVARLVVAAPVRPGGQAQFIEVPMPSEADISLAATRAWALERLSSPLTRTDLANHAGISVRTLARQFHAETGLSPLQWLLHHRVVRARELLETTDLPMDQVAQLSGLATSDSLRQHMTRRTGLSPSAYRATFTRKPPSPEQLASSRSRSVPA
jgi:transcriptional regulator GlxA family with amidase domain